MTQHSTHQHTAKSIRRVPVLATGQQSCHDVSGADIPCSGSGQDAESAPGLPWPSPRFVAQGETVRDALTGLVWTANPTPATFSMPWDESLAFVEQMNAEAYGGVTTWRMPGRRELFSLVSFADRRPALPGGHPFGRVFLGWYWTSTTFAGATTHAWRVHMEGGRMFYGRKGEESLLWPVSGESAVLPESGQRELYDAGGRDAQYGASLPAPRFSREWDGSVRDALTGLCWRRAADLCGEVAWADAFAEVAALVRREDRPWRLPTIRELESLADASRAFPALAADHPFTHGADAYWSSTTSSFETDWAMAFYLGKGAVGVGHKGTARFAVWAVMDAD